MSIPSSPFRSQTASSNCVGVSDPNPAILHLALRCDRYAPGAVRRALEGVSEIAPVLDDVKLVATELVNNAVLHSGCSADDVLRVNAQLVPGSLTISVHDPGLADLGPRLHAFEDSPEPGGMGLRIVEELARRWGAERPDGRRVWAELAL